MTIEQDRDRLIELADRAHEAWIVTTDSEPRWWLDLGNLLDRLRPLSFIRNSGDTVDVT